MMRMMMTSFKKVETHAAPKAIGPYSQAVIAANFVFVSGQLPIDPKTNEMIQADIGVMTVRVLDNIEAILKEAGCALKDVVRVDIFLKDLKKDFALVNEVYGKRFAFETPPARQTVQVNELPKGSPIEISCIACKF